MCRTDTKICLSRHQVMRLLKKRIAPKVHTPEMEIVMSTLHRVREFALAAVLVAQTVSFAPQSAAAESMRDGQFRQTV